MGKSAVVIGTRGYPSFYGGFETAVRRLAPFLADAGWDVAVYGRPGQEQASVGQADPRIERRVTRGIESRSLSTLTYGLTAVIDTLRRRPDVALVMNCANGFWLPLLKLARIPTVVNVDGIEWERAKWGRVARWVFRTGARLTARFGDHLVFDADAIGDYWREHLGRTGVMIPYGGTPSRGASLHPEDAHLAVGPYVLMVARFVPENTVPEFLDAAELIADEHDVVIVGSTGYGGALDERAASLAARNPRVHWLGHVADDDRLFALWEHAGAYFHGHSVGGTNPALVQAMHCGAPTIARDTVYNREVLGETAARFVRPRPAEIASSVTGLLRDDVAQRASSERARARASSAYSWERVCSAYEAALARAAGRVPTAAGASS
ncbi:glycosyltransferase [Curtobacterium luteum]|uniref:glycosyltransferase n=1 Tax=Curtobacterium luteum TaxID=33881 RepID=UPI00380C3A96